MLPLVPVIFPSFIKFAPRNLKIKTMFLFNNDYYLPPSSSGDPEEDFRKAMLLAVLYVLTFFAGIGLIAILTCVYHLIFA